MNNYCDNSAVNHYRQVFIGRLWRLIWLSACLSIVSGCQSFSYQTMLEKNVLESEILQSTPFKHRILKPSTKPVDKTVLHVYIEGDGRPWRARVFVAPDPTPRYALMLAAMQLDSAPTVYVGRPCYYHTDDSACSAMDWTMARYSSKVVQSMAEIVEKLAAETEDLWLIGHSGGGALAVLIGRRLNRQVNVLTAAANLDHRQWTTYHNYSPLAGSLNPSEEVSQNPLMREIHWYGSHDENVLPIWNADYCQDRSLTCREIETNHASGWLQWWPQILTTSTKLFAQ